MGNEHMSRVSSMWMMEMVVMMSAMRSRRY